MNAVRVGHVAASSALSAVLNFAVVGDVRSGTAVVQSCLDRVPGAVCHGDLLFAEHGTEREQDQARRRAHEGYFGPCREGGSEAGGWFIDKQSNAYHYLNEQVWDHPCHGEDHVGARLLYPQVQRYELYDLVEERWREGDFCLVHVLRNPVACFVSWKQAERWGRWSEHAAAPPGALPPPPIVIDVEELAEFVRRHESVRGKVRRSCVDCLEVSYAELSRRFDAVMQRVFDFLELPQQDIPRPAVRRIRNNDMPARIRNFAELSRALPSGLRGYLNEGLD